MSKTQTVAKPAAKSVTKAAPKAVAKPAQKAAPKTAIASAIKSLFVLADIARPVSGTLLFAHTMAAMHVLGMLGKDRPAVRTAALQAFVGSRAIKYHTVTKGTMELAGEKIRLTPAGASFFKERVDSGKIAKEDFEGFVQVFTKGTVPKDFAVKANHIVQAAVAL